MVLGGKSKSKPSQQKPSAMELLQQLELEHRQLYNYEMQILNEIRNLRTSLNIPDFSEDIERVSEDVRTLQGLLKGINADTKNINEKLTQLQSMITDEIKQPIDSINGFIVGLDQRMGEYYTQFDGLLSQLHDVPEQLGNALNNVLENFNNQLQELLGEAFVNKIDEISNGVENINMQFSTVKQDLDSSINEIQKLSETLPEEIGSKIEEKVDAKLKEFDQKIAKMEEVVSGLNSQLEDLKKMVEGLYKLFYGK